MSNLFKGILIDQSVSNPENVLKYAKVISKRETTLEGESFRGKVLFYDIEVTDNNLQSVLKEVAETIKSPGWYFHLVNKDLLYIVMPKKILKATNNEAELKDIIEYATSHGIHPEQLNLKQLFNDPFA